MRERRLVVGTLLITTFAFLGACSRLSGPGDKVITDEISTKLHQEPTLKTRDIGVATQSGNVVLTGQVQTDGERVKAEELVRQAKWARGRGSRWGRWRSIGAASYERCTGAGSG